MSVPAVPGVPTVLVSGTPGQGGVGEFFEDPLTPTPPPAGRPPDALAAPLHAAQPPQGEPDGGPQVTLGLGVRRPQGRRVALDPADPVTDLARILNQHRGDEAWWSPSVFDCDHRSDASWQCATVLGVDVDFHRDGKHVEVSAEALQCVARLTLPGTLWHPTPRGLRVVGLLDQTIVEASKYEHAATVFAGEVANALSCVRGLHVDFGASADHARLLFTPRATARGVERSAEITVIGGTVSVAALIACPPASRPKAASAGRPPRGSSLRTGGGVLMYAFDARGWLGEEIDPGKHAVRCPWSADHSSGKDFDTSTVIYAPSEGQEVGAFFCFHGHCRDRTLADVLACFTRDELRQAREAAGVVPDGSARDLLDALGMLRAGASGDDIMALLRKRAPHPERESPGDYARRTFSKAREIHERRLSRTTVTRVYLEVRSANGTKPTLAVLKLTLDGELLPRAKIVVPSAGYESARERFDAVAGDLDVRRLLEGDSVHARELVGREVEVAIRDGAIVWMRRAP